MGSKTPMTADWSSRCNNAHIDSVYELLIESGFCQVLMFIFAPKDLWGKDLRDEDFCAQTLEINLSFFSKK